MKYLDSEVCCSTPGNTDSLRLELISETWLSGRMKPVKGIGFMQEDLGDQGRQRFQVHVYKHSWPCLIGQFAWDLGFPVNTYLTLYPLTLYYSLEL